MQDFEQIAPVHRHQQAGGQVRTKLVLDLVGRFLEDENLVLGGLDRVPVAGHHRLDQARNLAGAAPHHADMLLHRLERRAAEQA